jgi:Mg/Co/Ni transporter MgtE
VVVLIAAMTPADATAVRVPNLNRTATWADYGEILYRNSLVLALHALACVAGFIAGNSLPLSAANRSGLSRWVHEKAGPLAIGFVVCATLFSLCTQAYFLGRLTSTLAAQFGVSPALFVLTLFPHALPELTALFLPLAAWLIASRRGRWDELLAATFVTVAIAVPVLLASAAIELWVTPRLFDVFT